MPPQEIRGDTHQNSDACAGQRAKQRQGEEYEYIAAEKIDAKKQRNMKGVAGQSQASKNEKCRYGANRRLHLGSIIQLEQCQFIPFAHMLSRAPRAQSRRNIQIA